MTHSRTGETLWAMMPNQDFILGTTGNFQRKKGITQFTLYDDHCCLWVEKDLKSGACCNCLSKRFPGPECGSKTEKEETDSDIF